MAKNMDWNKFKTKYRKENLVPIYDSVPTGHYMSACPTHGCRNRRKANDSKCSICMSFEGSLAQYRDMLRRLK